VLHIQLRLDCPICKKGTVWTFKLDALADFETSSGLLAMTCPGCKGAIEIEKVSVLEGELRATPAAAQPPNRSLNAHTPEGGPKSENFMKLYQLSRASVLGTAVTAAAVSLQVVEQLTAAGFHVDAGDPLHLNVSLAAGSGVSAAFAGQLTIGETPDRVGVQVIGASTVSASTQRKEEIKEGCCIDMLLTGGLCTLCNAATSGVEYAAEKKKVEQTFDTVAERVRVRMGSSFV
jgi:hypothetical protein